MYLDHVHKPETLARNAAAADPCEGLRAVAALRRLVDALEIAQVDNARRRGWYWHEIAVELGVTKQAVHQKHAGRATEVGPREG
jgi:hypothetical protein